MKLFKKLFTKKQLLTMMVGLVVGGGVSQAQYTGIGTTAPNATLHVVPVATGQEPLRVEGMIDLGAETTYTDVLLYDPASGLMRRESIEDLLDDNGQWIIDGSGNLVPRNAPYNGDIAFTGTGINISVPTTITGATSVTGTFGVVGNSSLTGTLAVSSTSSLGGEVTLGTVNDLATPVQPTDQILFHGPGGVVQKADVADVLAANGQLIVDGAGNLVPRNAPFNGDIAFTGSEMNVEVPTNINGATAVTGTFDVTGNSNLDGTLDVTGAAQFDNTVNIDNTLSIGTVAQVLAADIIPTDEILIQQAGTDLVEYVTVGDLLASNSYWDEDASVLTPSNAAIEDEVRIADGDVDINATNIDFTGTTNVTGAFGVTGNSALNGTLGVTGTSSLGGEVTLGTVNDLTTPVQGTDQILFHGPGGVVQKADVADVIADASYWQFDGTTLTPRDPNLAGDIDITDGNIDITATTSITGNTDVTGTFNVTGASTLDGTLNVTGNSDFDADVNVDGNTNLVGTLDIGTVAQVLATDLDPLDEVLIQQAGTDRVEYVTVADLVASNGEWVYDAAQARIYARRAQAGGADVWVTDAGNHVVEIAAAYQFADNTNQVTATGIDATADYTMQLGGNLTVNTATNEDLSFNETGAGVPWLFYDADAAASGEVGRVGINTGAPLATLHVAGNIVASNSTVSSDRRFKKDIEELTGALTAVKAMRGVSYDFRRNEFPTENFDDNTHIGFIAQELQEVLPQAVFAREDGYLTVDYSAVTPVLVEAVQELSKQVEALQAENATLRSTSEKSVGAVSTKQLRDLEARLADMDARLQEVAGRK